MHTASCLRAACEIAGVLTEPYIFRVVGGLHKHYTADIYRSSSFHEHLLRLIDSSSSSNFKHAAWNALISYCREVDHVRVQLSSLALLTIWTVLLDAVIDQGNYILSNIIVAFFPLQIRLIRPCIDIVTVLFCILLINSSI
jgi:hypothetical protein